jgi:hypothetical protein
MSDNSDLRHEDDDEAVQAVVDRVLSYQAGAPTDTVRQELVEGLTRIGEERSEDWIRSKAERISNADPSSSS